MSIKTLLARQPGFGLATFNDFLEPWNELFHDGVMNRQLTFPKVNISEDKTNYNLEMAAPGLHKKDFKISVNGDVLTIRGEKEENKEEKDEKYSRREYNYSSFSRSFTLPGHVEQDKIQATYDGGVLKLVMPRNEKSAQKSQKEIAIK